MAEDADEDGDDEAAEREPDAADEADAEARARGPPPDQYYEEVTLADLVVTIYDHRRAALAVFLGVLVLTVGATAVQEATAPEPPPAPGEDGPSGNETTPDNETEPVNETEPEPVPRYRADATVVIFHEREGALWALRSRSLAADAARAAGLVTPTSNASEAEAVVQRLRENTTVTTRGVGGSTFATVQVVWTDPSGAAALADAHVDALEDRRPLLENLTWARLWESYFAAAASENRTAEEQEALARARLSGYISGLTYVRPGEPAMTPATPLPPPEEEAPEPPPEDGGDQEDEGAEARAPEDPGPDWRLNLALGATLAAMLAFMTPFVLEAAANVREELEERRG